MILKRKSDPQDHEEEALLNIYRSMPIHYQEILKSVAKGLLYKSTIDSVKDNVVPIKNGKRE